ncbi:MAG: leucine-rich repeat domain-containing protein [Clostridia bacterium]|nr:leucine-rich repeat domain-containing protein [Clostridia bacterium]
MKKLTCLVAFILIIAGMIVSCNGDGSHIHNFSEWETVNNPTCTEDGEKIRYCDCGEEQIKPIYALGHTEVVDEAVDATCTTEGKTEGKHCSVCNEILIEQTVVEALGHTEVVDEAVDSTCTTEGKTEGKHCSVCNEVLSEQTIIEALGHTEVVDEAVDATCTTEGKTEGKHCSVCNEILIEQTAIPKVAHTYDDKYDESCNECGYIRDAECAHLILNTLPAKEATCTESGLTEGKVCAKCEEIIIQQTVIDALGHTEVVDKAIAPTCTETGLTEGKHCSVCREVTVPQTTVNALGHTEVIDGAVAPTCTETGLTEGKHCSVCGEVTVPQTTVNALGHTEVIDKAIAPTCTETGLTEGKHCSACEVILTEQKIVASLGHSCVDGVCIVCGKYISGLYNANDELIASWESLINEYGINIERDYPAMYDPLSDKGSLVYILKNNSELSDGAKLMLDKSVTKIGLGAFSSCTSLTDVVIPDTVQSIGSGAFYHCTSLKSIVIPDCITTIESDTFAECYLLSELIIPGSVTKIGNNAFYYCFSLVEIIIPENVKTIGDGAFQGCSGATSILLPDSLMSIGNWAFQYCDVLVTIDISENVSYIGESAFANCRALQSIRVDESNTVYKSVSGNLYTKDGNTLMQYAVAKQNERFIIPEGVTTIEESAFSNATQLISLVIPKSLVSVKDFAFYYCSQLSEAYYWGTAEEWQSISVDEYNSFLTDATFYYYSETEPTIEGNFWHYVDGAIEIWPEYVAPEEYLDFILLTDGTYSVKAKDVNNVPNNVIIPSEHNGIAVTVIEDSAFNECRLITSVTIPDSVVRIGNRAFRCCSSMTGLTIGNGVTRIEDLAFTDCYDLKSVTIPGSIELIGYRAFYRCYDLVNVIFETTAGWTYSNSYYPGSSTAVGIPSYNLLNVSAAASYLTTDYSDYYWHRN